MTGLGNCAARKTPRNLGPQLGERRTPRIRGVLHAHRLRSVSARMHQSRLAFGDLGAGDIPTNLRSVLATRESSGLLAAPLSLLLEPSENLIVLSLGLLHRDPEQRSGTDVDLRQAGKAELRGGKRCGLEDRSGGNHRRQHPGCRKSKVT